MIISIRIIYENGKPDIYKNIKIPPTWRILVEKHGKETIIKNCKGIELFRFNNENVIKYYIERIG